jgi:hypothetical protein
MHVAHQPCRTRKNADLWGVGRECVQDGPDGGRGRCAAGSQLARNARTGAVQNVAAVTPLEWCLAHPRVVAVPPTKREAPIPGDSGSNRRPGRCFARGIDADLHVRWAPPDAAGDDPSGKPRIGGAGGLGGEDRGRRGRYVGDGRWESLVGDGDDLRLRAVAAPAAALAAGDPIMAGLGVARFVQVAVLRMTALGWRSHFRAAARLALSA